MEAGLGPVYRKCCSLHGRWVGGGPFTTMGRWVWGVAERANRTSMDTARATPETSGQAKVLWPYTVEHVAHHCGAPRAPLYIPKCCSDFVHDSSLGPLCNPVILLLGLDQEAVPKCTIPLPSLNSVRSPLDADSSPLHSRSQIGFCVDRPENITMKSVLGSITSLPVMFSSYPHRSGLG